MNFNLAIPTNTYIYVTHGNGRQMAFDYMPYISSIWM